MMRSESGKTSGVGRGVKRLARQADLFGPSFFFRPLFARKSEPNPARSTARRDPAHQSRSAARRSRTGHLYRSCAKRTGPGRGRQRTFSPCVVSTRARPLATPTGPPAGGGKYGPCLRGKAGSNNWQCGPKEGRKEGKVAAARNQYCRYCCYRSTRRVPS